MAELEPVICNGSGWLPEAEMPAKPCPGCYNCLRNTWDDSQVKAAREAAREASTPVPEHKHEFGEVIGWGERAVRLCACGQWILAAPAAPTGEEKRG